MTKKNDPAIKKSSVDKCIVLILPEKKSIEIKLSTNFPQKINYWLKLDNLPFDYEKFTHISD
jgi:hypothetical protein